MGNSQVQTQPQEEVAILWSRLGQQPIGEKREQLVEPELELRAQLLDGLASVIGNLDDWVSHPHPLRSFSVPLRISTRHARLGRFSP
jgi:hypothetical protein